MVAVVEGFHCKCRTHCHFFPSLEHLRTHFYTLVTSLTFVVVAIFVCLFVVVVVAEYNTLAEQCYGTYMDTVRR